MQMLYNQTGGCDGIYWNISWYINNMIWVGLRTDGPRWQGNSLEETRWHAIWRPKFQTNIVFFPDPIRTYKLYKWSSSHLKIQGTMSVWNKNMHPRSNGLSFENCNHHFHAPIGPFKKCQVPSSRQCEVSTYSLVEALRVFLDLGLARFNCVSPEKQEK